MNVLAPTCFLTVKQDGQFFVSDEYFAQQNDLSFLLGQWIIFPNIQVMVNELEKMKKNAGSWQAFATEASQFVFAVNAASMSISSAFEYEAMPTVEAVTAEVLSAVFETGYEPDRQVFMNCWIDHVAPDATVSVARVFEPDFLNWLKEGIEDSSDETKGMLPDDLYQALGLKVSNRFEMSDENAVRSVFDRMRASFEQSSSLQCVMRHALNESGNIFGVDAIAKLQRQLRQFAVAEAAKIWDRIDPDQIKEADFSAAERNLLVAAGYGPLLPARR